MALRNNPSTQASWAEARAAAAGYSAARAAYLPTVHLEASTTAKNTASTSSPAIAQLASGPALGLSWLLLDRGRDAALQSARQTVLAANWGHNANLQEAVLAVQKAYFQYNAAKASVTAAQADLDRASEHLTASEAMRQAGVATIADVLQTKAAESQARLALQTARGMVLANRGTLASVMGVPATLPIDTADPVDPVVPGEVLPRVENLVAQALSQRPDLAAARARAAASEAQARKAEAAGLPTLAATGSLGTTWHQMETNSSSASPDRREDVVSAGLALKIPLFSGYAITANAAKARAEAEGQADRARGLGQQVIAQVFQSAASLHTAGEKIRSSADFLEAAAQSEQVATARFREGVGTVQEMVSALAVLANARAQAIQARLQWSTSLAQLARDVGALGLDGGTPNILQAVPAGVGGLSHQKMDQSP